MKEPMMVTFLAMFLLAGVFVFGLLLGSKASRECPKITPVDPEPKSTQVAEDDDGSTVTCEDGRVIDPSVGDIYAWKELNPFNDNGLQRIESIKRGWMKTVTCDYKGSRKDAFFEEVEPLKRLCYYKAYILNQ